MSIKSIVEKLIRIHESNCPFQIAKALKIQLIYEELGNIMGYFSRDSRFKFIHINQNLNEIDRKLTCAHELGHAILHLDVNTPFLKLHTFFQLVNLNDRQIYSW